MLVSVSEVDPEVLSIHWRMQPPVRNYLLLETASLVLSHKVLSKDIWRRGYALIEESFSFFFMNLSHQVIILTNWSIISVGF